RPGRRRPLVPLTRRATTLGLCATTLTAPALLNARAEAAPAPPDLPGVHWIRGGAGAKPDAYNLRTAIVPQLRARCLSEDGLRRALEWARRQDIGFSIQSGGHCFEGLSQSESLILDLSPLARVAVSREGDLIAQPGARIWQANDAAATRGGALPAGYCQLVGLGGHVCGGGLGVLSRRFGLTCDNLLSARVLTADGTLLEASRDANPDLFWALRGGGSGSFGIVTEFRLALHPVDRAHFADHYWLLPQRSAAAFLPRMQELALGLDDRLSAYLNIRARTADTFLVRLRLTSLAGESETLAASEAFASLAHPLTDPLLVSGNYLEIADLMWPRDFDPRRRFKNKSVFLDGALAEADWDGLIAELAAAPDTDISIAVEQMGGAIDVPAPEDTAFVHRRGPRFILTLGVTLPETESGAALAVLARASQKLSALTAPGAYVNYPDVDIPDWPGAYWGANYDRLLDIKRHLDPENVFRHAQSIGSA
ncbi:MAG: FAD-binding oxidoreductase, partial [Pseudomonadota bacterium]